MGEWRQKHCDGGKRWRRKSGRWGQQNRDSNWNWSRHPGVPNGLEVPPWEKEFCRYECMDWREFLEAKRFTHLFDNILNWNDVERLQAFQNAKARYWAKINGFKSEIPMPDPQMYADEVSQDEIINPDSNKTSTENIEENEEGVIIWGDFFLTWETGHNYSSDLPIVPTGWGDLPETPSGLVMPTPNGRIVPTGWGD